MRITTFVKGSLAIALAFAMTSNANAQLAIENPKILDNTYVTVNVGAAAPIKDMFSDMFPVNPLAGVAVGKWFTPYVAAELEATAWFGSHSYGTPFFGRNKVTGGTNIVRGLFGGLNGIVNLSNLFGGFTGSPRFFEVNIVGGIGWFHGFRPGLSDRYNNYWAGKTGFDLAFNIDKKYRHTLSLRPQVLWNFTTPGAGPGTGAFNLNGAQLYLGAAYTYHFKCSNGTHYFKTYNIGDYNNTIDSLREELAKKPKEVVKEVVKTVEVPAKTKTVVAGDSYVFFAQSSAELTSDAKLVLDNIEGTVEVIGMASPEGTADYNQTLSERRAKAVADYLTSKGVTVSSYKGSGVKGMTSARVAIIRAK